MSSTIMGITLFTVYSAIIFFVGYLLGVRDGRTGE